MSQKNSELTISTTSQYINPTKAWSALSKARQDRIPVYICGMSTYGKTELINQFFEGKNFVYYSARTEDESNLSNFSQNINERRKNPIPVVFDDIQFFDDEEKRFQILTISSRSDVWPIFVARPLSLDWMIPFVTTHKIVIITEDDLALTDEQIANYFQEQGIPLSPEKLDELQDFIRGNPYAVKLSEAHIKKTGDPDKLIPFLKTVFQEFMKHSVTKFWSKDFIDFFTTLSIVNSFTVELAEVITGNHAAQQLINRACSIANFLLREEDIYTFRRIPLEGFRKQAEDSFTKQEIAEFQIKAAKWHEEHNNFDEAVDLYAKADCKKGIKNVLILNARQNPSNGYYTALSKYYFSLTESEIESNIVLMTAMSMVCAMSFKIEESDRWLEKIREKAKTLEGKEKSEAKKWIAYLEIALPHHKSENILATIKNLASVLTSKELKLPEFCVTSNLPSVMNGGIDFCQWSIKDRSIATLYGKILYLALGKNGKPIVNLALAESLFEKAWDDTEVLSLMNRGLLEAQIENNLEMEFVATGLLIRFYYSIGQSKIAQLQFKSFEQKCRSSKSRKFYPNLMALRCRMDLYEGYSEGIDLWMKKYAPDETKEMVAMLRYQYLTKIRCYIRENKMTEAFALIEKMKWYANQYHRTYIKIECMVLSAIVLFGLENDNWRKELTDALEATRKFKFVRIISDEGPLVLPLLNTLQEEYRQKEKEKEKENSGAKKTHDHSHLSDEHKWFLTVIRLTERMSLLYPTYHSSVSSRHINFSDNARTILVLQMQGLSAAKIAEKTGISYENVRYHIKQNYKKLGVNSKTEAIIAARKLGIL
ncbi:MAG: hypothetical protein II563_10155 [Treponema sp.]|nr:hypothetical protein [Treponema sp.]